MSQTKEYVSVDEHGAMRVAETGVTLDSIVAAFEQGHSAETIQAQYPALTLEDVYGAIAYYLRNRDEVERYLSNQNALWRQWRSESERIPSPVRDRLRRAGTQKPETP